MQAEDCARIEALADRSGIVLPPEVIERAIAALPPAGKLDGTPDPRVRSCRAHLLREALLAALSSADVARWFAEHRADYDAALLSVLTVESEQDAWLVRAAAAGDLGAFDDLAWSRGQADPAKPAGAALGWRFRRDLAPTAAEAIFAAAATGLSEPVLGAGGALEIYRVWRVRPAALTAAVEAACRADLLSLALLRGVSA